MIQKAQGLRALKMTIGCTTAAIALCFAQGTSAQTVGNKVPQLGKDPVKAVVAAMTLEEKALMVIGGGRNAAPSAFTDGSMIGQTDFRVPGAAGMTNAIPRLGIPSMILADGPAGVRINVKRKNDDHRYYATAFPSSTTLASTWNPDVVYRLGQAFGNEVKEFGADIILAPGVNIHRNPLNGRNFEYYSEDPVVSGQMGAAIINGLQSSGIGTSIKHFAANNQETSRASVNAQIDERALREIYLKSFEIAIKASQPWTVMSSYNLINGTHTSERADLMNTILRDEWGFKGYVMTDWGGRAYKLYDQMRAGNEMIMPGNNKQIKRIIAGVGSDSLDIKVLDRNVERILNIILKSPSFKNYRFSSTPDLEASAKISREAATEGMVLLENHGQALPLAAGTKKIALLGNISYATIAGGTGSGDVNKAYTISVDKGLTNAGYQLDNKLAEVYRPYASNWRNWWKELPINDEELARAASECDIAIMTIGRNSGEAKDRDLDSNYHVKPSEISLISRASAAFHKQGKKLVLVLNLCGVIDTKGWKDLADAILLAWQPGQEAGDAVADILSGKVTPSGKLASTFPQNYADVPSAKNFPGTPKNDPSQVIYQEGIYVGYRYYDTFNIPVSYEFGYGLSYTTFSLSGLKLSAALIKDKVSASVKVTNTGKLAGKEVVQAYISAPAGTIDKPMQELKAFAKTKLLQPGETQILHFDIPLAQLASFYNERNAWVADRGDYQLRIGTSSKNITQTAKFTLPKTVITEKVHSVLHPQAAIEVYKP